MLNSYSHANITFLNYFTCRHFDEIINSLQQNLQRAAHTVYGLRLCNHTCPYLLCLTVELPCKNSKHIYFDKHMHKHQSLMPPTSSPCTRMYPPVNCSCPITDNGRLVSRQPPLWCSIPIDSHREGLGTASVVRVLSW